MYDKEKNELRKKIDRCNKSIENGNKTITGMYIMIGSVITVGTILSVALGGVIDHPILVGILGLCATGGIGIEMYENLVVSSKRVIDQRKHDIVECNDLISKYEKEEARIMGKTVSDGKNGNYAYKSNNNLTDNDMVKMIDAFKTIDDDNHKKKK